LENTREKQGAEEYKVKKNVESERVENIEKDEKKKKRNG